MQYYDANGDFDFTQTGQPNTTVLFNSFINGRMYSGTPFFEVAWDTCQVIWDETITGSSLTGAASLHPAHILMSIH